MTCPSFHPIKYLLLGIQAVFRSLTHSGLLLGDGYMGEHVVKRGQRLGDGLGQ